MLLCLVERYSNAFHTCHDTKPYINMCGAHLNDYHYNLVANMSFSTIDKHLG